MRALAILLLAAPAAAGTFGGFSGVDRPYLVDQDRICQPLEVKDGAATGMPSCDKAAADVVAHLSIKPPAAQRGATAAFAASASGKTLTVTNKTGATVVTWNAEDVIGKVVEVYASQYEDRVAVAYTVRRLGREVTEVVAFELTKTTGKTEPHPQGPTPAPTTTTAPTVVDPAVTKAVEAARKKANVAAWKAVLAVDAKNSEAIYRIATLSKPDALGQLEQLAKSDREDAIEWLIEARFDPAFAGLRADPKFRAAVGLDRKPTTTYERVMGFGGQWEQTGTSCDKPEVHLAMLRDRTFKLRVKTSCEGQVFDTPFKGSWRVDGDAIALIVPTKGQKASAKDEAKCQFEAAGDENALRCSLGHDLEFVVLPTRR